MINKCTDNEVVVLHANRIKGPFIVCLVVLLIYPIVHILIENTQLFVPFVLIAWGVFGFVAGYTVMVKYPHLFFYEIFFLKEGASVETLKMDRNRIVQKFIKTNDIEYYNIIQGYKKKFGYAIRVENKDKNQVLFIVPKINDTITEKKEGRGSVRKEGFYQSRKSFLEDFERVCNLLKRKNKRKKPKDYWIKFLYLAPYILALVVFLSFVFFFVWLFSL